MVHQIQKLLRQYGEHGNDYSVLEIGDTVNQLLEALQAHQAVEILDAEVKEKPNDSEFYGKGEALVEFESLKEAQELSPKTVGDIAVRSPSSQDRVYLVREGKKHWIKNPETLFKLGFNFHNVKSITNDEMDAYETSDDMDLKEYESSKVEPVSEGEIDKYNL